MFLCRYQDLPRWKSMGDYTIILYIGLVEISDSNHILVEFYPALSGKVIQRHYHCGNIFSVEVTGFVLL